MRSSKYETNGRYGSTVKVHVERYKGAFDLLDTAEGRRCVKGLEDDDYLDEGRDRFPDRPAWAGFYRSSEARERFIAGIDDDGFAKDVARYADGIRTDEVLRYRDMRRDVRGGAVCVPAVLAGDPRGMWCVTRSKTRSRIVRLGIDAAVTSDFKREKWEKAGRDVVLTVAALEKAGYRVGIEVGMSIYESRNDTVIAMSLPVKRPEETLSLRKVLYPLTDMSFFRGIGFGWIVRNPYMVRDDGLGTDSFRAFGYDDRDEQMTRLAEEMFSPGAVHVRMHDLCTMNGAAGYLRSLLLDAET